MRKITKKINGKDTDFILLAGIPKLVKVYSVQGHDKLWLCIDRRFFTVQDELNALVLKFINLKYQPKDQQENIFKDFKTLCELYKR